MKIRLFWAMLLAFVLVIALGVVGMLLAFGITFLRAERPEPPQPGRAERQQQAYADALADYYAARGSWQGIDRRLDELMPAGPGGFFGGVVVADSEGRVVASNHGDELLGTVLAPQRLAAGQPVLVQGRQVGTMLLPTPTRRQLPPVFWIWLRGMAAAAATLVAVLLGVAVLFAGRVSRPLRGLSAAARAVAAGNLDVQVPGAFVREIDDLAGSFNAMARSLADADRQRRQMTADIAHELRTPLAIIKGRLEGIQDGVYDAGPAQVERLLGEAALLERLIDDLRLLALAEAGQLPLYAEATAPQELLEDAAAALADQAHQHGVTLHVQAGDALPLITVDPQRMLQVLTNLIGNALRYTAPGGQITLAAQADARLHEVTITVRDSGQGIAPEDLPHIFERFYRADRARTRSSGGAGLGLAIVRQIVLAHGGTIDAASRQGYGTTFTVRLPVGTALAPTTSLGEPVRIQREPRT